MLERVRDVPREAWDALVGEDDSPFVEHTWLDCLEEAGCVRPQAGWLPRHLALYRGDRLVAAAPAYVKGNSEGEFVFDWSWADLAHRLGVDYYPKVVVAVPFTPATGARALVAPGEDRDAVVAAFATALREWVESIDASSIHVLFPRDDEAAAWERAGFLRRAGLQFHWFREGATSFADYLERFNAKRRHQIRREVAQPAKDGVTIETLAPQDVTPAVVRAMHRFYLSTVDKYFYGRRYLNARFFQLVAERFRDRLAWVVAKKDGDLVAGAFNVQKGRVLYGRYWGADVELPFLHFNVCYYHGIAHCITYGLDVFEPGAGGEHKLARGFRPTETCSAHWIGNARLRAVLEPHLARERERVKNITTQRST
jgi:predicted N-acyltransferase